MCDCQPADVDHRLAQRELDNAITHADNQQQEEREAVAEGGENRHHNKQHLCSSVETVSVLVVVEQPGHEHLHNEEHNDRSDVILDWEDVVAVEVVQNAPANAEQGVYQCERSVERQLDDLGGRKLTESIPELDNGAVFLNVVAKSADAVVASPLDWVIYRRRVFQMDRH